VLPTWVALYQGTWYLSVACQAISCKLFHGTRYQALTTDSGLLEQLVVPGYLEPGILSTGISISTDG